MAFAKGRGDSPHALGITRQAGTNKTVEVMLLTVARCVEGEVILSAAMTDMTDMRELAPDTWVVKPGIASAIRRAGCTEWSTHLPSMRSEIDDRTSVRSRQRPAARRATAGLQARRGAAGCRGSHFTRVLSAARKVAADHRGRIAVDDRAAVGDWITTAEARGRSGRKGADAGHDGGTALILFNHIHAFQRDPAAAAIANRSAEADIGVGAVPEGATLGCHDARNAVDGDNAACRVADIAAATAWGLTHTCSARDDGIGGRIVRCGVRATESCRRVCCEHGRTEHHHVVGGIVRRRSEERRV